MSTFKPLQFLVTADVQVTDEHDMELLARDVDRFEMMLDEDMFLVLCGDLTKSGTAQQFKRYREVMTPIWQRCIHVFGGHDGLTGASAGYNTDLFTKHIGALWQGWRKHGVHCLTLLTEDTHVPSTLREQQLQWLTLELSKVPPEVPLIVFCHIPPTGTLREILWHKHSVLAVFYGHWHEAAATRHGKTWYICTGSQRGRDWGSGARRVREVCIDKGSLRTQISSIELPTPNKVSHRWSRQLGEIGQMIGRLATDGSHIYCPIADSDVPHTDGGIACIKPETGAVVWHTRWPGGVLGSPLLEKGQIFALSVNGNVICLDRKSGSVLWVHELYPNAIEHYGGHIRCLSSVVKSNDKLLVLGHDTPLVVLDSQSGKQLAQYDLPPDKPVHMAAPVPLDGEFILASRSTVVRQNILSNRITWRTLTEQTRVCSEAIVCGNVVFFAAERFHAIDTDSGRILWTRQCPQGTWALSRPTIFDDFVIACGRQVLAMDQASGELRWAFDPFADQESMGYDRKVGGTCGFYTIGNEIIFSCDNGKVYALDAQTGTCQWSVFFGAPIKRPPLIAKNILLAHDYFGQLHAVDVAGPCRNP